jgi:hypothetical protein
MPRRARTHDYPTPTQRRVNDAPHRLGHAGGMADPVLLEGRGYTYLPPLLRSNAATQLARSITLPSGWRAST